jgi:hypothetical protein
MTLDKNLATPVLCVGDGLAMLITYIRCVIGGWLETLLTIPALCMHVCLCLGERTNNSKPAQAQRSAVFRFDFVSNFSFKNKQFPAELQLNKYIFSNKKLGVCIIG